MSVVVISMAAAVGEPGELLSRLSEDPDTRLVCFYRAPWEAALALEEGKAPTGQRGSDWVDEWTRQHTAMLQAWQEAPDRVILVNAVRVGSTRKVVDRLADLGVVIGADRVPLSEQVSEGLPSWAGALAAACFAELAAGAWECYEALESCAQLTGEEPELRGTIALGDVADLDWMLERLHQALEGRAALQREHDRLGVDLESAVARMEALEEDADSLRRENELLLNQIEQFNAEIGRVEVARAGSETELLALRQKVDADAALPVDDEMPALRRENELLVLQLEQLHEELDQEAKQRRATAGVVERATSLGERARLMLSRLALRDKSA